MTPRPINSGSLETSGPCWKIAFCDFSNAFFDKKQINRKDKETGDDAHPRRNSFIHSSKAGGC
jgi:hypothetical protein